MTEDDDPKVNHGFNTDKEDQNEKINSRLQATRIIRGTHSRFPHSLY